MSRIDWSPGSNDPIRVPPQNHGRRPIVAQKKPPNSFEHEGMTFLLVEISNDGDRLFYIAKCKCELGGYIGCGANWKNGNIRIPAVESMCSRCELAADNLANGETERLSPGEAEMQARLKDAYTEAVAKKSPQKFGKSTSTAALGKAVSDAIHRMLKEGYCDSVIAKELGCSNSTVGARRKKLGLEKPRKLKLN